MFTVKVTMLEVLLLLRTQSQEGHKLNGRPEDLFRNERHEGKVRQIVASSPSQAVIGLCAGPAAREGPLCGSSLLSHVQTVLSSVTLPSLRWWKLRLFSAVNVVV